MFAHRIQIEKWFQESENSDENLSLEFLELMDDMLTFKIGDDMVSLAMKNNGLTLFCESTDEFVQETCLRTIRWLKSNPSVDVVLTLDAVIKSANELMAIQMQDENEPWDEDNVYESVDSAGQIASASEVVQDIVLQKRWEAKELEIRARAATSTLDMLSKSKSSSSKEVLFSASASSLILIKDLLELMKFDQASGQVVEAVDDNIFNWKVIFNRFHPDSELATDLTILEDNFGYGYVELNIKFAMDLYPYYPPVVSIVRPRFEGFLSGRIASLQCLQLTHWNQVFGVKYVLNEIKKELQLFGRVEADSVMNDITLHPDGSYSPLERSLLQLGIVTEIAPRVSRQGMNEERKRKLAVPGPAAPATSSAAATSAPGYWAKGTGYGHGERGDTWDVKQHMAAQAEKDRLHRHVLQEIVSELDNLLQSTQGNELQLNKLSVVIEESCLVPVLEGLLRNDSMLDMERHKPIYTATFQVLHCFTKCKSLRRLLLTLRHQDKSLGLLAESLSRSVMIYDKTFTKKASSSSSATTGTTNAMPPVMSSSLFRPGSMKAKQAAEEEGTGAADLMSLITLVITDVSTAFHLAQSENEGSAAGSKMMVVEDPSVESVEATSAGAGVAATEYCTVMVPLQYSEASGDLSNYHYKAVADSVCKSATAQRRVKRLAQEHADLSHSLPLSSSSSVWLLAAAERMDTLQAMISGPEDTPYHNGLFLFDAYFPHSYPNEAPKVNLQTTGRNTVRFNPNLYSCGKVCLSLLGTWHGQASESWNETSTFLQVLVSIQSLIFVPDPYFNEPSYEASMHTAAGNTASAAYNNEIRAGTVRWGMMDHLEHPIPGFEEVTRLHFLMKRDEIKQQVTEWCKQTTQLGAVKTKLFNLLDAVR